MAEVTTVEPQRPLMTPELLKAAMEGTKQVLTSMLGLEESRNPQVNVIIDAGPAFEQRNHLRSATSMGNTVLHLLCLNDHDALTSKVCNKDNSLLKARNKMLETPLHCAAKAGCMSTVIELLKFGQIWSGGAKEMVRERNCHGETALHEAARHHRKGTIDVLMNVDPKLAYEVDNYGISALEVALARGNNEMAEILSDQKINKRICSSRPYRPNYMENTGNAQKPVNMSTSVDILGSPAIHLVASVDNTNGALFLLENDAFLAYLQDSDGLFPIHVAARMGHVKMVIFFMKRYLESSELLDHRGRNFLHIAAEENKFNIFIELFMKFDEYRLSVLWKGMLTRMLNSVDNNGNTPLHLAAEKGGKLVMTLTEIDEVDQDIRNRSGLTPFDLLVIQAKESAENSQDMQDQIEQYVEKNGARITSGWFELVMYGRSSSEKKGTSDFIAKLQIIGLGAVLITTVTFAVPFTLPDSIMNGSKYVFKAFIVADTLAFVQSFFCTVLLMFGGLSSIDPDSNGLFLSLTMFFFINGARCLVLAFGLGWYLVLSPMSRGFSILILVLICFSLLLDVSSRMIIQIIRFFMIFKKEIGDSIIPYVGTFFSVMKYYLLFVSVVSPLLYIFLLSLIH